MKNKIHMHTCQILSTFLFVLLTTSGISQNVEVLSDMTISGGLNFSGFSTYVQDTFTIDIPGIEIVDGEIPQGTIVTFVASASNSGNSYLEVDNGTTSSSPKPIVKRGAVLLQENDIVAGEIVMAVFNTMDYHLLTGFEIPAYLTNCNGQLVNTNTNESHCGECDNACPPGHLCVDGSCVLSCQAGLTNCSGTCVDLDTDENNCGSCDSPCAAGEICVNGICETQCPPGLVECNGSCVDVQTNESHCNACNNPCDPGHKCENGTCVLECQNGLVNCAGTCTNLQTDNTRCGDCNTACASNERCVNGQCEICQ